MAYTVKWSGKARDDYFDIIDYLIENWGRASARKFKDTVEEMLSLISKMPSMYPVTEYRGDLRRCVVVRQVSMYYQVNETNVEIYIVRFYDNRRDDAKLPTELGNI